MNKIKKPIFVRHCPIGACGIPFIQQEPGFENVDIRELYYDVNPVITKTIEDFNFSEIYDELINIFDIETNDLFKNKKDFIGDCRSYCDSILTKSFWDCFIDRCEKCTNDIKGFYGTCYMKFLNKGDLKMAHNKDVTEFYDYNFEISFSLERLLNKYK